MKGVVGGGSIMLDPEKQVPVIAFQVIAEGGEMLIGTRRLFWNFSKQTERPPNASSMYL